jgi:hypothetical protein
MEQHFTEGAVMIAFAMYLLDQGAVEIELHPDGEHGKRYDFSGCLKTHGFDRVSGLGKTSYGGVYRREKQTIKVTCKSGLGDVVARIDQRVLVAECKGGIINSQHAGQTSKLRRGLCEAVGLLLSRSLDGERHVAVVPATQVTERIARRMLMRANAAGIEIALVDEHGAVRLASAG